MLFTDRVLTGIRPTGSLHLGHYTGALKQWVSLQRRYECFFLIADYQAMTTHADRPAAIRESIREVVLDFLAVGLNPKKRNVHFVLQSWVPELNQLYTLLSMVTKYSWIGQNPTIKTEKKLLGGDMTLGFADYPVSQAADILFVSFRLSAPFSSILVPVGEDQIPHLELTNRIARTFNRSYGKVFTECKPLVGDVGRLVGTDGQEKMSKSLGNAIYLKDDPGTVRNKVMRMFTDPNRVRSDIPGNVDNNPVFIYLNAFAETRSQQERVQEYKERYERGKVGDVEVKMFLVEVLEGFLEPIRDRRRKAEGEDIIKYLRSGTRRARVIAKATLNAALEKAGLTYTDLNTRR